MKIVIISDIHDNLINLEKCLNWSKEKQMTELICCGDIANSETLKFLSAHFLGIIHLVAGNADLYNENELDKYKNIKYYGKVARFKINNYWVGLCHQPYLIESVSKLGKCSFIFYGHTHKPWTSKEKDKTILVNPGTLGGMFLDGTFAVWDTDKQDLGLKLVDKL